MTNVGEEQKSHSVNPQQAEKFLSFQLGPEEFVFPVSSVREIISLQNVTPVPQTPSHVAGVLNLRGRVVPVIDMRRKLGMPDTAYGPHACIIIVQIKAESALLPMGAVVDGVSEVLTITSADWEEMPVFGTSEAHTCLQGVAKIKNKVKLLLDIHRLLSGKETTTPANSCV